MRGEQIKMICEKANVNVGELSNHLNVTKRTVDKWIDYNEPIDIPYAFYIRTLFKNKLLVNPLREIAKQAFEISHFEYISVSFVSGKRLILLKDVARLQLIDIDPERFQLLDKDKVNYINEKKPWMFLNPEIHKDLNLQLSMTTNALRTGEIVMETHQSIKNDNFKFFKNANNTFLSDGICHSLLKIPYMIPSATGPTPTALLALDNKLEDKNGNFNAINTNNIRDEKSFFDLQKVDKLKLMFRTECKKELQPLLDLLGYIGENHFEPPVI